MPPTVSSGHLLFVFNAPVLFLRERVIRNHFGKFGTILSVEIKKSKRKCIITFQRSDQVERAIRNGSEWKSYKLDLNVSPLTDSGTTTSGAGNSYDIEGELNWFAEEDFEPPPTGPNDLIINVDQEKMEPKNNVDDDQPKRKMYYPADDTKEVSNKRTVDTKAEVKILTGNDVEISSLELLSKVAPTINSRLALLEERDKILRIRLNRDSNIKTAVVIKGLCPDMCPEKERILRDVRGIVACYEAVEGITNLKMDHSKAVKDYARSSADQEEPLAHELRPEPVLSMTMDYIITQIMPKIDTGEEDNLSNWFDFCWYRMRSIRKDIIQQQLCDINTVEIVEKCARFHICCFDRLWGVSKSIFDEKINAETLMNCLQSLSHMYEDLRKQGIECPNEAEFRAYLILLKVNSGFLLSEYQQYSSVLQRSQQVKDAVSIHTAYSNKMYSTYFRLMKKTSYLNACLMQRFLSHLRTKAMDIIIRAHCPPNKIIRVPISFITQTLKFDSRKDCINFCESFGGLVLADDSHNFIVSRNEFCFPESLFVLKTPSSLVVHNRVSVAQAVVGVHSKLPLYIPHEVHTSFNEDGTLKQGALDATDQEEKLYRDIVERKLILKRGAIELLKSNSSSEQPNKHSEISPLSPKVLIRSPSISSPNDKSLVKVPSEEVNDINEDEEGDEEEVDYDDDDDDDVMEVFSDEGADSKEDVDDEEESDTTESRGSLSDNEPEIEAQGTDKLDAVEVKDKTPTSPISFVSKFDFKQSEFNLIQPSLIPPKSPGLHTPKSSTISSNNSTFTQFISPRIQTQSPSVPAKSPVVQLKSPELQPKSPIFSPSISSKLPSPKSVDIQQNFNNSISKLSRSLSVNSLPAKKPKLITPISLQWNIGQPTQWKSLKYMTKKDKHSQDKLHMAKLKKIRSSERMKKISVRRYALLWRNKVKKLKKSDRSLREYFHYWGTTDQFKIPKSSFNMRLFQKKKTGLIVLSILHSNIVDRIDPATGKIGQLISDKLGILAIKFAQLQGNVSQPFPVFWKIIFSLPPSLKGPFTFPDKLKRWCTAAFYTNNNAKLGDVQYRLSNSGVPVFMSANVLMGSNSFEECCRNISAAIVIRTDGWETKEETQQRCDNLISTAENKIPLAILTLGEKFENCNQFRYFSRLSYFTETLWNNTDKLINILMNLVENNYFYNIKVDSLRTIITILSEKLFDSLHEDKFINDGLFDVLCEPNNIIKFYNELIYNIEKEITTCYESKYYGTACEFEQKIKNSQIDIVQFPSHYKDLNFLEMLKKYLTKAKLPKIKWPFTDSKELLTIFKDYLHDLGCDGILSKVIRTINPPDSNDFEHPLSDHLLLTPWLRIIEDIIKEILKLEYFHFNVVYRPNKLNEIIDTHWWMTSDIVITKQHCNLTTCAK